MSKPLMSHLKKTGETEERGENNLSTFSFMEMCYSKQAWDLHDLHAYYNEKCLELRIST